MVIPLLSGSPKSDNSGRENQLSLRIPNGLMPLRLDRSPQYDSAGIIPSFDFRSGIRSFEKVESRVIPPENHNSINKCGEMAESTVSSGR